MPTCPAAGVTTGSAAWPPRAAATSRRRIRSRRARATRAPAPGPSRRRCSHRPSSSVTAWPSTGRTSRSTRRWVWGSTTRTCSTTRPWVPTPAWFIPGTSSTWVVFVHGRGETPREGLRIASTVAPLGYPMLLIQYRNDPQAPAGNGYGQFGVDEWQDLEGAVQYALDNGAERIVLAGASMGGAASLAFLRELGTGRPGRRRLPGRPDDQLPADRDPGGAGHGPAGRRRERRDAGGVVALRLRRRRRRTTWRVPTGSRRRCSSSRGPRTARCRPR